MANSEHIVEANQENFNQLVIEQSKHTPVLVDFWADWCQPCQMLMPVLAKLAEEYNGAFKLVKVNSDQNQALAQQYGVRSLPTVKVFKNGEIVDEFMGVQPEAVIRELIDKHRVRLMENTRQEALQALQAGDLETAEQQLNQVIETEPDYYEAYLDLAQVLLEQNKLEAAQTILDKIPANKVEEDKLENLKKTIQRKKLQEESGDIAELETQLAQNPDDIQTMLDLAKAKVVAGDVKAGLDLYLEAMQKDREFGDDAARKGLLEAFDLFEKNDPLIKEYRARLYSLLY